MLNKARLFLWGGVLFVKKIINYIIIYIFDFIISANICYNLTYIIKNNIKLEWNLNEFYSFIELKDISLLFGTILLSTIIILFILKYDKELKLKLQKLKKMPKEDSSYEYGSSRWATKKEIKKEFKIWNIGSKLSSGGIPVTFMDGKYYYYDSFDHTLIIGSTGSGKTICNILPMVFILDLCSKVKVGIRKNFIKNVRNKKRQDV